MSEKITIEQVEKLQERANVSYEEAKDALEKCGGDILEALIMLEKEGKTAKPGGGAYSTNGQNNSNEHTNNNTGEQNNNQSGPQMNYNQGQQQQQQSDFNRQAKSVWQSFLGLLHKGNINHFVVSKNYQEVIRMPVNLLILLLIIFNAAAIVVLIVFLFFGYKYSFDGPNLGKQSINNVMDSASNTAEDIKESVKSSTADNNTGGNNDGNNNNQ